MLIKNGNVAYHGSRLAPPLFFVPGSTFISVFLCTVFARGHTVVIDEGVRLVWVGFGVGGGALGRGWVSATLASGSSSFPLTLLILLPLVRYRWLLWRIAKVSHFFNEIIKYFLAFWGLKLTILKVFEFLIT